MKRFEKTIPTYSRKDVPFALFIVSFLLVAILTVVVKY